MVNECPSRPSCPRGSRESLFPLLCPPHSSPTPSFLTLVHRSSARGADGWLAAYGQDTFFKASVWIIPNTSSIPDLLEPQIIVIRVWSSLFLVSDTWIEIIRSWSPSVPLSLWLAFRRAAAPFTWLSQDFLVSKSLAHKSSFSVKTVKGEIEARVGILLSSSSDPWAKTGHWSSLYAWKRRRVSRSFHVSRSKIFSRSSLFFVSFLNRCMKRIFFFFNSSSILLSVPFFFTLHRYKDCCWCFERNTFPFHRPFPPSFSLIKDRIHVSPFKRNGHSSMAKDKTEHTCRMAEEDRDTCERMDQEFGKTLKRGTIKERKRIISSFSTFSYSKGIGEESWTFLKDLKSRFQTV